MTHIRVTHHGILTHRIEGFHLALGKTGEHERNGKPDLIRELGTPGFLELGLIVDDIYRLVA